MRDDLLPTQATVDWAVAQIPLFQNAFLEWNKDPYEIVKEPDPDNGGYLIVAYQRFPLPLTFNAWAGAMINSLRSALDLLAAALATRNGKKPSPDTHFPIFTCEQCMIDPLTGIEGKKWLSQSDRVTIKSFKPYRGGDSTIWPLHHLDVLRKHQRLISVQPDIGGSQLRFTGKRSVRLVWGGGGYLGTPRLENKSILHRAATPEDELAFDPAKGDATITSFITFDEIETLFPVVNQEISATLFRFSERVSEIIRSFDGAGSPTAC